SNISYSALKSSCRIDISWIDYLDQHLRFDPHDRILYLFRYPSYCAAACASGHDSFLSRYVRMIQQSITTVAKDNDFAQVLVREVLLSYRILFSQDKKSRFCLSKLQSDLEGHGFSDPLLNDLCAANLSQLERKYNAMSGVLDLPGSSFAGTEFRYLGKRLLAIQEFSERHRPRKLREIYLNRRDSEKYYTFWAVIWIGGLSIVLSILQ
ncbi:hypothetical protein K505DRAFT_223725, partial [Melanomma pulvis-pyrius CBS 109.77]